MLQCSSTIYSRTLLNPGSVFFINNVWGVRIIRKEQVLEAYQEYEIYLASLNTAVKTEEDAHTPISQGKWSIAEIVLHLAEWDRFFREQRLPLLKAGAQVAPFPDVDAFNAAAVAPAKQMAFPEVLARAQKERALLAKDIEELEEGRWNAAFKVGSRETTVASYSAGFLQHDAHHRSQIDGFLHKKSSIL